MKRKIYKSLGLIAAIMAVTVFFYPPQKINAEKILANSSLNGRTFSAKVQKAEALDGKISAYLLEEHSIPLVSISFGFTRSGSAYEEKEGISLLTENAILDGAGKYSRRELRELMREKGIKLSVSATRDRLEFSLSYVKQFEKDALKVLKAVLYEPHFNDEDLNLARRQLAVLRKRENETPQHQLKNLINNEFYGQHPYGREAIPSPEKLQEITAEDIKIHLRSIMGKDNLAVGIAGDIDKAETEALLTYVFAALTDKSETTALPTFAPDFHKEKAAVSSDVSAQSFVLTATQGIARLDTDFYPLYVANDIFGGSGLASRLNKAVREKEGLTYGIYSYFALSDASNLWHISFSSTPENAEKIMAITTEEYTIFRKNGVSAEETAQAKESMLSSFNLRFTSLPDIADMLEQMQVQKLGIDFLQKRQGLVAAVTQEQINRAIKNRLPEKFSPAGGVRIFEVSGTLRK